MTRYPIAHPLSACFVPAGLGKEPSQAGKINGLCTIAKLGVRQSPATRMPAVILRQASLSPPQRSDRPTFLR